ncbi:hypothetical protein B7Y94_05610, partial [Candidatus Saccharibacteria bacterium 32-49-12]
MDDIKAKQQLVEKIKESTNILVTVSDNPSVDALSGAIGLTMLLDKMGKYATAVFSGTVPPAIAFLEPEKVLDDTTDSLRDFIIALDKEKADHLRYKVDGDVVKIFITPYKTTITSDDLDFSQGDYNVELIIALGVDNQENLDAALDAHGQILHDATVATLTAGEQTSTLGGIDWHDDQASSLSEMLVGLGDVLKPQKGKSPMNADIATAFLTGIVAETERFSNPHTTSKSLTVASQLMAAGADQQLIATKLEEAETAESTEPEPAEAIEEASDSEDVADSPSDDVVGADGTLKISKHETDDSSKPNEADSQPVESKPTETLEELDRRVKESEQAAAAAAANEALASATVEASATPEFILDETAAAPSVDASPAEPVPTDNQTQPPEMPTISDVSYPSIQMEHAGEPMLGGTLNATTDQAEEDARRQAEDEQNKTILSHGMVGGAETSTPVSEFDDQPANQPMPGTPAVNAYGTAYAEPSTPVD